MKRKWIYYLLTGIMGGVCVCGILNTQLIVVSESKRLSSNIRWELIITGFGSFSYALSCIFLSSISDRFGRLPCIAISSIFMGVLNALMGWKVLGVYQIWHFFFYWGLANLSFAVIFTGIEGLLSDYQDHSLSLAMRLGMYCVSWCLGDAIAAFITGYTKQSFGPEILYKGISIFCLLMFVLTVWDWVRFGYKKLGETDLRAEDIKPQAPFHATIGRIGLLFGSIAYSSLSSAFPRFGRDFHRFSEGEIGNLISLLMFISMITFLFLTIWRRWQYNLTFQMTMQMPMAIGLLIGILTPSESLAILAVGFMLFGFGWASSYFFSIYYSLTVPANHSKSGGIHEAVIGVGNLIGPFAAVVAIFAVEKKAIFSAEKVGVSALIVGLACIIFSLSIQIFLIQKEKYRSIKTKV